MSEHQADEHVEPDAGHDDTLLIDLRPVPTALLRRFRDQLAGACGPDEPAAEFVAGVVSLLGEIVHEREQRAWESLAAAGLGDGHPGG